MEVPFETAEQVEAKLVLLEELLRNRYTEEDKYYAMACKKSDRRYHVPEIYPWPPSPRRKRDYDRKRGGYRRGGYREGGHDWDRYPPRDRMRGWHDDHHPSSWHGRRSPRSDHYERTPPPYKGRWGQDSSPPHNRSPSHAPPRNSRARSPWQQDTLPRRHESDVHGGYIEKESKKMDENTSSDVTGPSYPGPHPLTPRAHEEESSTSEGEGGRNKWRPPLDLNEVAGFNETVENVIPSKSDVLDILNIASFGINEVTSENLKKVQKEQGLASNKKKMKHKESKRPSTSSEPTSQGGHAQQLTTPTQCSTSRVHVTHGHAEEGDLKMIASESKNARHHHHHHHHHVVGVVSMETGVVGMETKSKSGKGHDKSAKSVSSQSKKKQKKRTNDEFGSGLSLKEVVTSKRKRKQSEMSSEDDSFEVDVTTPLHTATSLSVSFKKRLMGLDADDDDDDNDATDDVGSRDFNTVDTTDGVRNHNRSLMVSIDRTLIRHRSGSVQECPRGSSSSFRRHNEEHDITVSGLPHVEETPPPSYNNAESGNSVGEYRIEFGGEPTKMIIRSSGDRRSKKKKKKKTKRKVKTLDDSADHTHKGGHTHGETNSVQFTDPLRVKIKLI